MKSNGGKTPADAAEAEPIKFLLSGLAGGIIAGQYFGQLAGAGNLVTLDMGGTSCDVGLVRDGKISHSTNFEIEWGLPVATPTIDLTTIGAGGGSIAWIDKGGLLRVGPQSAGADPGPVCYDTRRRGGHRHRRQPRAGAAQSRTTSSAARSQLSVPKAEAKLDELGERLRLDRMETAQAVVDIANENMANAIRVLSIDRGLDPREYALVAFGGAGPLHAADIAAKMGMTQVIVPVYPGLTSAFGALIAEPKITQVWSKHFRSDAIDAKTVGEHFDDMVAAALDQFRREGYDGRAGDRALDQHALLGTELRAGRPHAAGRGDAGAAGADAGGVPPPARAVLRLLDHRRGDRADPLQRHRLRPHRRGHAARDGLERAPPGRAAGRGARQVYFQEHGLIETPDLPARGAAGRVSRRPARSSWRRSARRRSSTPASGWRSAARA